MAKKIIIKEKVNYNGKGYFEVNSVIWCDVPAGQQPFRADANFVSSYPLATQGETDAIRNGSIAEFQILTSYLNGTPASVIKADLINIFNIKQAQVNSETKYNFYSTYYDGSSWTTGGA
jgi:hypothetical protein